MLKKIKLLFVVCLLSSISMAPAPGPLLPILGIAATAALWKAFRQQTDNKTPSDADKTLDDDRAPYGGAGEATDPATPIDETVDADEIPCGGAEEATDPTTPIDGAIDADAAPCSGAGETTDTATSIDRATVSRRLFALPDDKPLRTALALELGKLRNQPNSDTEPQKEDERSLSLRYVESMINELETALKTSSHKALREGTFERILKSKMEEALSYLHPDALNFPLLTVYLRIATDALFLSKGPDFTKDLQNKKNPSKATAWRNPMFDEVIRGSLESLDWSTEEIKQALNQIYAFNRIIKTIFIDTAE
jgi:hypothetical protein